MSKPKYKLKPEAIARQLANLEDHELQELESHISTLHPIDQRRICSIMAAAAHTIHTERIDELEEELDQLKKDLVDS